MSQSPEALANRDKRLFRFLVGSICSLPFISAFVIVAVSGVNDHGHLIDTVTRIYVLVGLSLFISLLVFSIRVWRRNRRLAWKGFGFIGFVVLLGILLAFLPEFL